MKLKILSRSNTQRVVPIPGCQVIAYQILRCTQDTARELRPDHHYELLSHLPFVPVILLVNAVKLQEFIIIISEAFGGTVSKRLRDGTRQERVILLQAFISGKFNSRFGSNHKLVTNVNHDYRTFHWACQRKTKKAMP